VPCVAKKQPERIHLYDASMPQQAPNDNNK
jgi:hypothetical protein